MSVRPQPAAENSVDRPGRIDGGRARRPRTDPPDTARAMQPLTDTAIRRSMVNCSRSEAASMTMPEGLSSLDWEARDFLGWRDPRAPGRAYLVQWRDGEPLGLMLRAPGSRMSRGRAAMCALCHYGQSADNVALFTARRAGQRGRDGQHGRHLHLRRPRVLGERPQRGSAVGVHRALGPAATGRARTGGGGRRAPAGRRARRAPGGVHGLRAARVSPGVAPYRQDPSDPGWRGRIP